MMKNFKFKADTMKRFGQIIGLKPGHYGYS